MRRLLLARHGAAAPAVPGASDHERPLTPAGRAAVRRVGERLAANGGVDLALVSTARRARESLDALVDGGLHVTAVTACREACRGGPDALLDLVRETPDDVADLLVVGHVPGLPGLVDLLLADGSGSDADRAALARGLAPGAVVCLGVDRPWAELDPRQADLLAVHP